MSSLSYLHLTLPSLSSGTIAVATLLVAIWGVRLRNWHRRSRGFPLPPGPRPFPIVGNLFDIPTGDCTWKEYARLASHYGDIMYLQAVQSPMVVVSSARVAFDLMEKRSAIYSDKPSSEIDKMTYWDWNVGLMPYGPRWRSIRRLVHQYFNQFASLKYRELHLKEVRAFVRRAAASQECLSPAALRETLASVIVSIVYGRKITGMNDEYVLLAMEAVSYVSEGRKPGALWVDFMPFLSFIPPWVPGAAAAKLGAKARPVVERLVNMPFDLVKNGKRNTQCIASELLAKVESIEDMHDRTAEEEHARHAAGIIYAAGTDTSSALLLCFFSAMSMHPEIQRQAQEELDEVVGPYRLPNFDDYNSLPYIQAIYLECARWLPTFPVGIPHRALKDDHYNGYFIPEGTLVVPINWLMLHNPEDYPEPESFKPERFLKEGRLNPAVRDPTTISFGFGRRICPGRYFVRDHAFATIATMLHVFDIVPPLDENGIPIDPTPEPTSGLLSVPDRLHCILKLRSAAAEELVTTCAA